MKKAILTPEFRHQVRQEPKNVRQEVGRVISESQRSFGQPHLHKGLGVRKLRDDYYEVRVGRKQRLVFENTPDALVFECLGDHDDVKQFLKSR